jgi:hypothetical protein
MPRPVTARPTRSWDAGQRGTPLTLTPSVLVVAPPPIVPAAFVGRYRPWADPRVVWVLALIPHTVAIAVSARAIAKGHRTGNLQDFLDAARAMRRGADIYASGAHGYVYPPLIAFLYQPLAMLGDKTASFTALAVEAALSVFTLALVSRVLARRLTGRVDPLLVARVALFGAVCTADKIKGEFSHLETNVFMLLAFTAAMRWVDKRPWLCGLALGFAFNIKYLPIVLVPYLLLRRRWRATAWFAVWAVVFGALPAVSMGWRADAAAWGQAAGGLLKLFGIDLGVAHPARVRAITDAVSISLTSGLARVIHRPSPVPLLAAAAVGVAFCGYAVAVYLRNGVPLLRWPSVRRQHEAPYRGLLSVEWIGILLLTLVFSPFTNSRHLYMLLDVNIAAAALLLGTRGVVPRLPLAIGAVLMFLGITFPPGGTHTFDKPDVFWRTVGGPGWCMLAMYTTLIWTNVRYQRNAARPIPTGVAASHDCA